MKAFAIIGASVLAKAPFTERLIEALRIDGRTVSAVKHAPDGFDIDTPGKVAHAWRGAGAHEVMLVGDRRLVIMSEFGSSPPPPLEVALARLAEVDLVVVEGFHDAAMPTLEVLRPSRGRAARWPANRHVVAIASDEPVEAPLPCFGLDDIGAIADHMARAAGLDVP